MDLRNMRQLLAIRAHGSVAKAARALGISQPSLSQAIRRMEDQLRVTLIDRSPAGSELTPIGELIVERAAKVVGETEQLIREAELIAGGDAGMVRIGIGTSLKPIFLSRFLTKVAEERPALKLSIQLLDRDKLLPLLVGRELDMVICALGSEIAMEGMVATPVLSTRAVAVAHPNHPLAKANSISIARFTEYPTAGASTAEFSNAELLGRSGHVDQYAANDYDALLPLVMKGAATLLAPAFVVRPHVESGDLVELDLDWRFVVTYAAIATRAGIYSPIIAKLTGDAASLGEHLQE
jgi:molybdate transport repressor ModE-like protein